jgi:hypothetical protein
MVGRYDIDVTDAERISELDECHHGRISPTALKVGQVLLRKA